MSAHLVGSIDVAQVCLVVFIGGVLFLFVWLRREDKREGYPLVDPAGGKPLVGFPLPPPPKTYQLMHGGSATLPHPEGRVALALRPLRPVPGAPLVPTGDAMQDGVGPASYASKKDDISVTWEGTPLIQPLRKLPGWSVAHGDVDLRGMPVKDADGVSVGIVADLWLDNGGKIIRYVEIAVTLAGGVARAMVPIYFTDVSARLNEVRVPALFAKHFAAFPQIRQADTITALEEDKVSAFCAGGLLYGKPRREESVL